MSEFGGTPLHLGTMHPAVRTVFTSWPPETLEPGDAIIMNTPYPAGPGHLNDVCVVGPVFIDGELFAVAASQSHRVDIGGYAPGSMPFGVTEHFQEGLQITPMKIMRRGVLDEHLLAFINQNVRTPEEQTGDLMAQVASNVIAQRRIQELADRHGKEQPAPLFRGAARLFRAAHDRRHPVAARGRLPRRGRDRGRRHRRDERHHPRRGHRSRRPLHRRLLGLGPAGARARSTAAGRRSRRACTTC